MTQSQKTVNKDTELDDKKKAINIAGRINRCEVKNCIGCASDAVMIELALAEARREVLEKIEKELKLYPTAGQNHWTEVSFSDWNELKSSIKEGNV